MPMFVMDCAVDKKLGTWNWVRGGISNELWEPKFLSSDTLFQYGMDAVESAPWVYNKVN